MIEVDVTVEARADSCGGHIWYAMALGKGAWADDPLDALSMVLCDILGWPCPLCEQGHFAAHFIDLCTENRDIR